MPREGVSPVKLGMACEELRAAMRATLDTFPKAEEDDNETDAYQDHSSQVFFDANEKAEYMRLSASKSLPILYRDHGVFKTEGQRFVKLVSREAPYEAEDPNTATVTSFSNWSSSCSGR